MRDGGGMVVKKKGRERKYDERGCDCGRFFDARHVDFSATSRAFCDRFKSFKQEIWVAKVMKFVFQLVKS